MNELWQLVQEVAQEHTEMVMSASLRELSELVVERAAADGKEVNPPSTSHMKYILEKLGYSLPEKKSHKGFIYKWKGNHE